MVPLQPESQQCRGVNMDCVHTLLTFMERRLESVRPAEKHECYAVELNKHPEGIMLVFFLFQGEKIKERLTPILNLLTESCRAHRETRQYIRKQVRTSNKAACVIHFLSSFACYCYKTIFFSFNYNLVYIIYYIT